jgi:hypothetical protein
LGGHVATAMRDLLDGRWPCERDEPAWRVGETTLRAVRRTLMLGDTTPSALETAIGASPAGEAWPAALDAAVAGFRACRWPLAELGAKRLGRDQDGDRRRP